MYSVNTLAVQIARIVSTSLASSGMINRSRPYLRCKPRTARVKVKQANVFKRKMTRACTPGILEAKDALD
jgi:hypothetical protein